MLAHCRSVIIFNHFMARKRFLTEQLVAGV